MDKRKGYKPLAVHAKGRCAGFSGPLPRGFTLIELLVVIAIIALLMSILMPALSRAKGAAKDVICKSQLHQWGIIWKMVTDDNKGNFFSRPDMDFWMETITEQYDTALNPKLWLCPNATKSEEEGGRHPNMARYERRGGIWYRTSYGVNFWVSAEVGDERYWKTPSIRGSSYAPMFVDAMETDMEPFPTDDPQLNETDDWDTSGANEMQRCCLKRHGKYYVNVVFLDFCVRRKTIKEMWRVRWHKLWPAKADLPVWPAWMADVPEPD
jgi:prepilin-type N-terminal cleavage/methylation domain-containing protein